MRNGKGQFVKGNTEGLKKGHKLNVGRILSVETKQKISDSNKGKVRTSEMITKMRISHLGKKLSQKQKDKISDSNKGIKKPKSDEYKKNRSEQYKGKFAKEKHPRWISDRSLIKVQHDRRTDSLYTQWRLDVYKRDRYKCKISNKNCCGRIEAHHILSFTEYKELRYEINNGITLCRFHHPKKRSEEARLSPYFKQLITK